MHFGYDEEEVLRGLDLHVAAGERVALVGSSGSGKSTVVGLVQRLLDPDRGQVLVDGYDVRDVTLHSLRGQIGAAFEESFLFSDTLAANIAYGRPGATREEVEAAARVACADDFIRELPDGYDTTVGERGLSLSGGQRQRVALARAVLMDPRVLLLDDATSAVDSSTEETIFTGLRSVLAGRTSLIVAHRVSTLHLADRVVLLDGGRVADDGTHDELMARNAAYRELLTGLDAEAAASVGDSIETLTELEVTPEAWQSGSRADAVRAADERRASKVPQAASLGPGMRGSGWQLALAPDPRAARPGRGAAARARPHRPRPREGVPARPGLLDARAGLGVPLAVRPRAAARRARRRRGAARPLAGAARASTTASRPTPPRCCGGPPRRSCVVVLVDFVDQVAETFVTGRTSERVMAALRIRIWAQLQRLSLDYYEREMAGRT